MSAVTESDITKFPGFVCKRKRSTTFQSDTNDNDPWYKELYSAASLTPVQLSQALALPKSLNPCESAVFDALTDISLPVKDKEYVWKIFCHIKAGRKNLLYHNSELKRCKAECVEMRKELEECVKKLARQDQEINLAVQFKKLAENRASEIEMLQMRIRELKENLESEKLKSELLRSEIARQKARIEHVEETVVPNDRIKFFEQQVKQLSNLLAHHNEERSLENSKIVNENKKIKLNYEQAVMMISQLKVRLAQKLKERLAPS